MSHLQDIFRALLVAAALFSCTLGDAVAQTTRSLTPATSSVSVPDFRAVSTAAVQVVTPRNTGSGSLHILEGLPLVITSRQAVMGVDEVEIYTLHDLSGPALPTYIAALSFYSMEYDFAVFQIVRDINGRPVNTEQVRRGVHRNGLALQPLVSVEADTRVNRGEPVTVVSFTGGEGSALVHEERTISSVTYETYQGTRTPGFFRTGVGFSRGSSGGIALNKDGLFLGIPTTFRTGDDSGSGAGSILSMHLIGAVSAAGNIHRSWDDLYTDTAVQRGLAPQINGEPYFGEHHLRAGFTPDPFRIAITAGGELDISYLGGDCVGHISQRPDTQLHWSGSSAYVTFKFVPDQPGDDTTLLINAPDGSWYCNDDAYGGTLDPALTFYNPDEGRFDIWVGTYHEGEFISGHLHITETEVAGFEPFTQDQPQGFVANPARLNFQARPTAGSLRFSTGFTPFPHILSASAGGPIDLAEETDYACAGFAGAAPSLRFDWSGDARMLQFYFRAEETSGDATMLIRDPDGLFHCNDDLFPGNLNPGIHFNDPAEGRYLVWLGTFREGETVRGKLEIAEGMIEEFYFTEDFEEDFYYDEYDEGHTGVLDYTREPNFGFVSLREGFIPDPHVVRVTSGGIHEVEFLGLGEGCLGHVSTAPDFRIHWEGHSSLLHFFFKADNDTEATTLVINAPDGSWHCNAGAFSNTFNPLIRFNSPQSGQYDIWVGSLHMNQHIHGELRISELSSTIPR